MSYTIKEGFLNQTVYFQLKFMYESCLRRGLNDPQSRNRHGFIKSGYHDGHVHLLNPLYVYPADVKHVVHAPAFIKELGAQHKLDLTLDIRAMLYYFAPNCQASKIMHDGGKTLFNDSPLASGMLAGVNYQNLRAVTGAPKLERQRSICCVLYLNDDWQEGDGGETSLYSASTESSLLAKVKPIGNTLLTFTVDENSFYSLTATSSKVNKLMIWWYHTAYVEPVQEAPVKRKRAKKAT